MFRTCTKCGATLPTESFMKSGKNRAGKPKRRNECNQCTAKRTLLYNNTLRIEVLMHYGGKCACCGFDDLNKKVNGHSFLHFDHINGGGRSQVRKDPHQAYWLKKNNFPDGYRILCASCNIAMAPNELTCEFHKWAIIREVVSAK